MKRPQRPGVPDPGPEEGTVRLPDGSVEGTVRLPEGSGEGTVRLSRGPAGTPAPPADRLPAGASAEPTAATLLDASAWGTPIPTVGLPVPGGTLRAAGPAADTTSELAGTVFLGTGVVPPGPAAPADGPVPTGNPVPAGLPQPGEVLRFGPGVPAVGQLDTGMAAAVWHGTVRPEQPAGGVTAPRSSGRRRALRGWLLPILVLLVVIGYLLWQRAGNSLAVAGVTVRTDRAGPSCNGTAVITGTLRTTGGGGTVDYRWRRSDGGLSGELTQQVAKGDRQTDVVLRWTFDGRGSMQATATLEILSPGRQSAQTSFTYSCT